MPFGPIYIIDKTVIFGIYPPDRTSNFAPMLQVPASSQTGELIIEAYNIFKEKGECGELTSPDDA